jgi:hypothetical protein
MKAINLVVLFLGSARAIIESVDPACGAIDLFLINSAITDAITVATGMLRVLFNIGLSRPFI